MVLVLNKWELFHTISYLMGQQRPTQAQQGTYLPLPWSWRGLDLGSGPGCGEWGGHSIALGEGGGGPFDLWDRSPSKQGTSSDL